MKEYLSFKPLKIFQEVDKVIAKTREIYKDKRLTNSLPSVRYVDPEYVYLGITNQRCATGESFVKPGDHVNMGQVIGLRHGPFFDHP